jgi:4-hydroxy-2-oxoheptanedioate aldolase
LAAAREPIDDREVGSVLVADRSDRYGIAERRQGRFAMPVTALRNVVKEKLARDEVVASMIVRIVQSPAIATLAARCGFDSLYVDLEHSPLSLSAASDICVAALAAGIAPFVRVPATGPDYVSRALDGGALGVIAPHVESADMAAAVVDLCRFPPFGHRSEGGPMPQFAFDNPSPREAHRLLNEATSVVVMIESSKALDHLDEIAAVRGVDMLLVGSNDLCADLGIAGAFDDPLLRDAFVRVIAAARRHGKHVGIGGLASRLDLVAEIVAQGARYVSTGADLGFLMAGARAAASAAHALPTKA